VSGLCCYGKLMDEPRAALSRTLPHARINKTCSEVRHLAVSSDSLLVGKTDPNLLVHSAKHIRTAIVVKDFIFMLPWGNVCTALEQ
jgi:hypothetical protein